jgi:hypothetical protein
LQANLEALTKASSSFEVDKKNMLTAIDKQASQITDLKATNEVRIDEPRPFTPYKTILTHSRNPLRDSLRLS